jgi:hypothetical protein
VRLLSWMFLDPRRRGFFGKLMLGVLRIKPASRRLADNR